MEPVRAADSEFQNPALDGDGDVWAGLSNPAERRRIQNRLNKRAERKRQKFGHALAATTLSDATSSGIQLTQDAPTAFQNGGSGRSLIVITEPFTAGQSAGTTLTPASTSSTRQPERHRRKRWAPKVTTGCLTCRARHLKCDEARPACGRCTLAGRHCSGYVDVEVSKPIITWQPDASSVGLYHHAKAHDRQMFYFMRTAALGSFSGVFDRRFWLTDVVCAAQEYPAIWHAGLAITAMFNRLHDAEMTSTRQNQHVMYAMQQYGKCMRSIINITHKEAITHTDKEVVLLASIMLIGFCCQLKDNIAAYDHMGKGLQVFRQWRFWEGATGPPKGPRILDVGSVTTLFRRFELQYVMSSRIDRDKGWEMQPPMQEPSFVAFKSLTEVCSEFITLQLSFLTASLIRKDAESILGDPNNLTPDHLYACRTGFKVWKTKFEDLLESQDFRGSDVECILTLKIWSELLHVLLHIRFVDGQSRQLAHDEWTPSYRRMAALTHQLYDEITKNAESANLTSPSPAFSFSLSVVEPLAYVGKCRDGSIRRKVISFLRKWPRIDGVWNPRLQASILEETMLYEESYATTEESAQPDLCQCIQNVYICGPHRVTFQWSQNIRQGVAKLSLRTELDIEREQLGHRSRKEVMIYY